MFIFYEFLFEMPREALFIMLCYVMLCYVVNLSRLVDTELGLMDTLPLQC